MTDINENTGLAEGTFGLAQLADQNRKFHAIVRPDGSVIDISGTFANSQELYTDWDRTFDKLVKINAKAEVLAGTFDDFRPLPPTEFPQIFGAGSNYRQHAAEMYTHSGGYESFREEGESDDSFFARNMDFVERRRATGMPFFWMATHGSLAGANDDIVLPPVGEKHDWEGELCAVLAGGSPRFMDPTEAADYIAGYTMVNDMHTLDYFNRSDILWNNDWIIKQQPGFKLVGPFVVPRQFAEILGNLQIRLWVNDEIKQDWPTSDMIFSPAEFIAYASERVKILAGDLLMTGSPPGNGGVHGRYLHPGDRVELRLNGLGVQRNRVVAEEISDGRKPYYGIPSTD